MIFFKAKPNHNILDRMGKFLLVIMVSSVGVGWASTQPSQVEVMMDYWAPYYSPAQAIVSSGEPIHIMNPTSSPHTITHEGCRGSGLCAFDTGAVQPGKGFTIPSLPPGRYPYYCVLHPIMKGEIIVLPQQSTVSPTATMEHATDTIAKTENK